MEEIKKGDIVVNYNRSWIGIFDRWNLPKGNCYWQYSLHNDVLVKENPGITFSSAFPATKEEKDKFKKALLKEGYSYYRGKVIKEL